jgi:hypothetical protein
MRPSADSYDNRQALYRRYLRANPRMLRAAERIPLPRSPEETVCSYVLAPALGAFTQWLLERSVANGVRRLYFLARDGYFFYQAAQMFCRAYRLPVDCRYLSCSRYSLRIPLFHRDMETALDYVCRGGLDVTPEKLLGRAGLTGEETEEVLSILSLPYGGRETIPYAALSDVRQCLKSCGPFLSRMEKHSREALPNLTGYLEQEGLLENASCAVVDSGWTGSMQKSLGAALEYMGRAHKPEGYYWGLYELPAGAERAAYHSYYFSPENGLKEKVHFNNCLFEAVYTAPHGMTLGYRHTGEAFVPIYGDIPDSRKAFVRQTGDWLMRYIQQLTQEKWGPADFAADRAVLFRLFKAFMGHPTPQEAAVFGSLPFSDDVLEGRERPIAAPLSQPELRANHALPRLLAMTGAVHSPVRESAWYEGSAVGSGAHTRRHLRQNVLYQYLRHGRKILLARKRGRRESS